MVEEEQEYRPPVGHVLEGFAHQRLTWKHVFGEWIDNSLDAGATQITFTINKGYLSVDDNGSGCPDPQTMIIPGSHSASRSTRLGRYGIGGKDSALWVGNLDSTCSVVTVHGGVRLALSVNWKKYAASEWKMDKVRRESPRLGQRGTTITIVPPRRELKRGQQLDQILDELGYIYTPALKQGAQIQFIFGSQAPIMLKAWKLPRFREGEIVDTAIRVGNRTARLYCGILAEGEKNKRSGLSYLRAFRVILPASSFGCGEFSPSHICGFVQLDETWPLTKNKDDIVEADQLYEAISRTLQPMLQRSQELGKSESTARLEGDLTEQLRAYVKPKVETDGGGKGGVKGSKEKRNPGNTHGTVIPRNSGRRRKNFRNTQPADSAAAAEKASSMSVEFGNLGGLHIGKVSEHHITLNLDNAWIARMKSEGNTDALVGQAFMLVVGNVLLKPGTQLQLNVPCQTTGSDEELALTIGRLLNGAAGDMPDLTSAKALGATVA